MTHERFVDIIDGHNRIVRRTAQENRERRKIVQDYNKSNRMVFGPNFNEFVTRMMDIDGISEAEVLENETPLMANDPDLQQFDLRPVVTTEDVTQIVIGLKIIFFIAEYKTFHPKTW